MTGPPPRPWLQRTALAALLLGLFLAVHIKLPSAVPDWAATTILYDRSGAEVFRFHGAEDRQPIALDQVPGAVKAAFLAIEDPRFYKHGAFDLRGILRAGWNDLLRAVHLRHSGLQGASTITQQLARDAWLGQQQTWSRKLQEAGLAVWLESVHSKDEILELYLNQIYFGNGAYGVQRAAQLYFHKPAAQLTPTEGALLAGLINGPSEFDPYAHPDAALARRNLVLDALEQQHALSPAAAAQARAAKLGVAPLTQGPQGNAFTDTVLALLTDPARAAAYGIDADTAANLESSGLRVYTTLDPKLQATAEAAVRDGMAKADQEYGLTGPTARPEAAAVLLQPGSGHVLALVGGRQRTAQRQFNRAVAARRQPGSAFKPFADYTPAIEAGLSPATVLDDAPVSLTPDGHSVWPENYDHRYEGLVSLRYAVEQSLNPVAVRALRVAGGPARGLASARRFGFQHLTDQDAGEALALGGLTQGVTPLEMAVAYGTLANLGTRVDPVLITRIEDAKGKVLYSAPVQQQSVVSAAASYLMVDTLKGVIQRGTAYGFTNGFHGWAAAGKTGTTDDNRDAWFNGFTRDLVTVIWTGYDTPKPLPWTGAFVPVQIWNAIMNQAVTAPPKDWQPPADVVRATVCRRTGMLVNDLCPPDQAVSELFLQGHVPTDAGNLLVRVWAVPGPSGGWQLWQPGCYGLPQARVFIHRPEPYLRNPAGPNDPHYIPADAGDELPTAICTPWVPPTPQVDPGWIWQWLHHGKH